MKKMHTWERKRSGTTKRLDSFWDKRDTAEGVREVRTIQKHLIASDHWLHFIDWEVKGTVERENEEEEEVEVTVNNKKRGEEMKKRDWDTFRAKMEGEMNTNSDLLEIEGEKRRDYLSEEDIEKGVEVLEGLE